MLNVARGHSPRQIAGVIIKVAGKSGIKIFQSRFNENSGNTKKPAIKSNVTDKERVCAVFQNIWCFGRAGTLIGSCISSHSGSKLNMDKISKNILKKLDNVNLLIKKPH